MGRQRAYLLPVGALRALLSRPENRGQIADLVRPVLPAPHPPAPLGPVFTRVPGSVVRTDAPTVEDLDRLMTSAPVPADRGPASWLLLETVASALSAAQARAMTDRPAGLSPLGVAVPEVAGLVVGSWTLAQAGAQPATRCWLDDVADRVPDGSSTPDVVVFWSSVDGR